MNFTYKNFTAKQDDDRFTLVEAKKGKDKDGKVRDYEETHGYGYHPAGVIRKITMIELSRKNDTKPLSEMSSEIKKILNEVEESFK